MKNLITILCLCLFWFSCFSEREEITERWDNQQKKTLIKYRGSGNDEKVHEIISFNNNGQEIHVDDKIDSIITKTKYYNNGNIKEEVRLSSKSSFHMDTIYYRTFSHDGKKRHWLSYRGYDRYKGILLEFDEDRIVKEIKYLRHNIEYIKNYFKNGNISEFSDYNKKHYIKYFENGNVEVYVESDQVHVYYENGNKKYHGYTNEGVPINIHTEFHENGNIKSKTVYKPGSDHGKQNLYDENGDIILKNFDLDKHLCQ
tara:strand:+ start:120 stop:890 length:771 start_codon:yes stop_codon:yes gene_type:complete